MTLEEMAEEYRRNTALLELRLVELKTAAQQARQREVRYRLKKRASMLRMLINESRKAAFTMEHYYDERGGEEYEPSEAV